MFATNPVYFFSFILGIRKKITILFTIFLCLIFLLLLNRPQKHPNMVLYDMFSQPYIQYPVPALAYVRSRLSLVYYLCREQKMPHTANYNVHPFMSSPPSVYKTHYIKVQPKDGVAQARFYVMYKTWSEWVEDLYYILYWRGAGASTLWDKN